MRVNGVPGFARATPGCRGLNSIIKRTRYVEPVHTSVLEQ